MKHKIRQRQVFDMSDGKEEIFEDVFVLAREVLDSSALGVRQAIIFTQFQ